MGEQTRPDSGVPLKEREYIMKKKTIQTVLATLILMLISVPLTAICFAEEEPFVIPKGTKIIENEAFAGCTNVTSVTIPSGVTRIGNGAFNECSKLTNIYFEGTAAQWEAVTIGEQNDPLLDAVIYCEGSLYSIPITERHFPDDAFQKYVSDRFDKDSNGRLSSDERNAVDVINVTSMSLYELKGLEYFTELRELLCADNHLTDLNTSSNAKLEVLICGNSIMDGSPYGIAQGNDITDLDLSNNPLLKVLWCPHNKLRELDTSHNLELEELGCFDNQIEALELSKNTKLQRLLTGANPLNDIDVSKNTELWQLNCYNNGLTHLDLSNNGKITFLWCNDNELTALNVSSQTKLETLNCSGNQITELNLSNFTALKQVQCGYNNLTELTVQNSSELFRLDCIANRLSSLDTSTNVKLTYLVCWNNQLRSMDLSANISLVSVNLSANQNLSSLTLGNMQNLQELRVQNTSLTSLDIKNCPVIQGVYQKGTRIEFNGDGTVAQNGMGSFYGYKLGNGLNPDSPQEINHCAFCFNKTVRITMD